MFIVSEYYLYVSAPLLFYSTLVFPHLWEDRSKIIIYHYSTYLALVLKQQLVLVESMKNMHVLTYFYLYLPQLKLVEHVQQQPKLLVFVI